MIIFQSQAHTFLSAGNIVNLFVQASVFVLLGLAEIFALLLSEIDLSVGFVAAVGAFIIAELIAAPNNWPWWAAIIVALAATARHRCPSGHTHHQAPPAVVRRDPRRPARLGRA